MPLNVDFCFVTYVVDGVQLDFFDHADRNRQVHFFELFVEMLNVATHPEVLEEILVVQVVVQKIEVRFFVFFAFWLFDFFVGLDDHKKPLQRTVPPHGNGDGFFLSFGDVKMLAHGFLLLKNLRTMRKLNDSSFLNALALVCKF